MSSLAPGKPATRKQSRFQRHWARVERLKAENNRLSKRLDALIIRIQETIQPAERDAAIVHRQLLTRLFTLGQRKSLGKWQRETLDDWVRELLEEMHNYNLVDQSLLDSMARYEAYRIGLVLDESDDTSPYLQLQELLELAQQEAENQYYRQQQQQDESREKTEQERFAQLEIDVEVILDERLGPAPVPPDNHGQTIDMLQPELDALYEAQAAEYTMARATLRKQLLAEMKSAIRAELDATLDDDYLDFDPEIDFDFNADFQSDEHSPANDTEQNAPPISNAAFQRMFRATAAKLHPDREPDPAERRKKQSLMADLLRAREKGDLITIVSLYQQYAGGESQLSQADEEQLLGALEDQIAALENEKQQIISQSPLHQLAHDHFYNGSGRKVDQAFAAHLAMIASDRAQRVKMVVQIRSLKTLGPWLDARYQQADQLSAFMETLDRNIFRETPFSKHR